jgi:hypothetical protein
VTVAVLGPGAVGGVLAAGFLQAGVGVVCVARPATAEIIRSQGLSLRQGQSATAVWPEVVTELREPVELLLVTVKAPALDEALDRIEAPPQVAMPLLNGIEHVDTLRERLPETKVVGGSIGRIEAWLDRPGVVIQPTPSVVMTVAGDAPVELAAQGASPRLYVVPFVGTWPGLDMVATPEAGLDFVLAPAEGAQWSVERLDSQSPAWVVTPQPDASALGSQEQPELRLELTGLVADRGPGVAHVAVYAVDVPGAGDRVDLLSIRLVTGSVRILSFTVTPARLENINTPTPVYVSWEVTNSSTVTLSGYGKVDEKQNRLELFVEESTTFVLTAYDSAFHTIVSEAREVKVVPDLAERLVPAGTITAWSGSLVDIPTGWVLCDGQNGTPDLRDRFVLGAGSSEQPHAKGEADTHTHTVGPLSQTFPTSDDGQHTHGMPTQWYARNFGGGDYTAIDTNGTFSTGTQTQAAGQHRHNVTVSFPAFLSGPNTSGVRPRWYALAYIMKRGWQQ